MILKRIKAFLFITLGFVFILSFIIGCITTIPPRNSQLIVTYEGKVVHHAAKDPKPKPPKTHKTNPIDSKLVSPIPYSNKKNFDEKIRRETKTYVVFGADWCGPCVKLKNLLGSAGVAKKVVFLDSSQSWVATILIDLGYPGIPYTVVYQNGKPTGVIRLGLSQSLMFLVINIDAD